MSVFPFVKQPHCIRQSDQRCLRGRRGWLGFILHSTAFYNILRREAKPQILSVSRHSAEPQKPHNEGIIEYLSVSIAVEVIFVCVCVDAIAGDSERLPLSLFS